MATETMMRPPFARLSPGTGVLRAGGSGETWAYVFSQSGQILREYPSFTSGSIPAEDTLLLAGQILMFSNPMSMPFSRNDIILASKFHLAELQAEGISCMYSMTPNDGVWPDGGTIGRRYDEIRNAKEFAVMIAAIKYSPDFLANSPDHEQDIFRIRRDLICQKLARELGIGYRKIPLPGLHSAGKTLGP